MKHIAVCQDNYAVAEEIKNLLFQYPGWKSVIDIYYSGEAFLKTHMRYDIIFLGIEFEGVSGIEVAKQIRKLDKEVFIIFITSCKNFYQSAFNVHAFQYLIKPIYKNKLYLILDEILEYEYKDRETVCIKRQGEFIRIEVNSILYFEYIDRKIRMVFKNGEIILAYSLKEIKEIMNAYNFESPHRAFLVNLECIEKIKKYEIILSNGTAIPIAQKKASIFKKNFNEFLNKQR